MVYTTNRSHENNFGTRVSKVAIGPPGGEELLGEFAHWGEGNGQTIWPTSIALDTEGNVYVSDEWLNRVSVFDKEGNFLDKWGTSGAHEGELSRPSGMAFDQQNHLYIVDSGNNRIQKFTREGAFLAKFGDKGSGEGQFNLPWGITIDNQDNIYVADWKNHRIQKFSPNGTFMVSFGTFGAGAGELNHPTDVTVDGDGDLYVADWANHRVQIFAPNGDVITSLIGDAQELSKWGRTAVEANLDMVKARRRVRSLEPEWRFYYPTAVAFDQAANRIVVADTQRARLQIYIKDGDYVDPQFNL